jgi:hypothetical protein
LPTISRRIWQFSGSCRGRSWMRTDSRAACSACCDRIQWPPPGPPGAVGHRFGLKDVGRLIGASFDDDPQIRPLDRCCDQPQLAVAGPVRTQEEPQHRRRVLAGQPLCLGHCLPPLPGLSVRRAGSHG